MRETFQYSGYGFNELPFFCAPEIYTVKIKFKEKKNLDLSFKQRIKQAAKLGMVKLFIYFQFCTNFVPCVLIIFLDFVYDFGNPEYLINY